MKMRVELPILAGLIAAVAACGGPPPQTMTPAPIPVFLGQAEKARADSIAAVRAAEEAKARAEMIHFDFDRSTIRPGDTAVLDDKIPVLKANAALRIQIAGNCDERGSDEYNLSLGKRRAISAKQYLVNHGIDASRIETVSYGKERPLVMSSAPSHGARRGVEWQGG